MRRREPRKKYSEEFKREAVRMCQERPVLEVAEALGVHNSSLYDWEKEFLREKKDNEERALTGGASRKELEEENKRLKREVENLKEEAEILKKASAYFAKYLR